MFNVQKFYNSHEIYINYNEYVKEEEDESIECLEHMIGEEDARDFKGTIDLITVKGLSKKEFKRIKEMHDLLKNGSIIDLNIISDNQRVLQRVKRIMPDVSIKLLKID